MEKSTYDDFDGSFVTTVTVVEQEQFDPGPFVFRGSLNDVIGSLEEIRNSIPEQYRGAAECEFKCIPEYGDWTVLISVEFTRPATEDEIRELSAESQRAADTAEERDRQEYERLKQKFGDKT